MPAEQTNLCIVDSTALNPPLLRTLLTDTVLENINDWLAAGRLAFLCTLLWYAVPSGTLFQGPDHLQDVSECNGKHFFRQWKSRLPRMHHIQLANFSGPPWSISSMA